MNRRDFLKLSLCAGCSTLIPALPRLAAAGPLDNVDFNAPAYDMPQTIMVFLYGGPSELAGNFTNYNQFKNLSQSSYQNYFGDSNLQATTHGFWQAAGGDLMEELLAAGDLNVFRTCFSQVRWDDDNRSHGICVAQNQRGTFNQDAAGIFSNLARVLYNNEIIDTSTTMPFLTMEGESGFFARGDLEMIPIIEPISMNENLDNPFTRGYLRYTDSMDSLAQARNQALHLSPKITDAFAKRSEMEAFIDDIDGIADPELGTNKYDENNTFARKLKTAVKIMNHNADTRVISLGSGGLGGWDDHNDAGNYLDRMDRLFRALRSAVAHIHHVNKIGTINIMVMGDFGRGLNLNSANGWDHGNLQNFYLLGGTDYFNTLGVVGETAVNTTGSANRLYSVPKSGTYWFEPLSVAATIYSIYGITNPGVLTGNQPVIDPPGNPLI